jgi:hypothetical protein
MKKSSHLAIFFPEKIDYRLKEYTTVQKLENFLKIAYLKIYF